MLLFSGPGGVGAALQDQSAPPVVAVVSGERVNIRAGAHTSYEVLGKLSEGVQVNVLDREGSWVRIALPSSVSVYVHMRYVGRIGSVSFISGDRVNIRAGATVNAPIVGQAQSGQELVIRKKTGDWYEIEPLAHCSGWIYEEYLSFPGHSSSGENPAH
ncbi:MAG: SH3 domain-containing protein [Candidatus Omnitrophica bacterium]|nr:SH3 domain-containing protein [Candidatus Omnitrophota bacterium]